MKSDPRAAAGDELLALPSDAAGRWAVTTSSAVYVLDLDRGLARRVPAAELADPSFSVAGLRGDYASVPLFAVTCCAVGSPMQLLLSMAPPAVTVRTTTPVRQIEKLP